MLAVLAALALGALGLTAALARSGDLPAAHDDVSVRDLLDPLADDPPADDPPEVVPPEQDPEADAVTGRDDVSLVERLDLLEDDLPDIVLPEQVTVADAETFGTLSADGASTRAVLDVVEPELRRLFVDADDATSEVAEAVALVASGWIDVWQASGHLLEAETHDLAFPIATFDADGVATGADELRGEVETGLALVLQGRERLRQGYTALRELRPAEGPVQARFDQRAADEDVFDLEVRPRVHRLLSLATTAVLVPHERFETDAPGVEARARSMTITCVDRAALVEAGGQVTDELLAEFEVESVDCPDLPADVEVRGGED